jgi:acetyl-CoA/propionyl-CoA carboxylase biotin carboxyl carrier protein
MFDSVLIANRGEIAVRVARTVHALGLRSVAVFTDVDADAAHVDAADLGVRVESYLDADALVSAATSCGADAIHPGYGFLSENAGFARAVANAELTWVGPPPEAIALMGDKARAKRLAREAGVPGLDVDDVSLDELHSFGSDHGFPLIIKAVAGGGGKGMRVVRSARELRGALDAARREAQAAFGESRVLVERCLDRARHIEVQVLADRHGNTIHLGERECSLQRRHQKVVEEAPSPTVDAGLRARMGEAAIALARASGYEGAGTVEFIVEAREPSIFYFLEMNTRLQVEHPVTEVVYGVDLVEMQLRAAAGERLDIDGDELHPRGHAIEARLYAEDPANGFLPTTGKIRHYREPAGEGVRVDSGVREGSEIVTSYDPLLAKVIAHSADRPGALRRLDRALADFELLGVATNAPFTRRVLRRSDVRAGEVDNGLLERVLMEHSPDLPEDLLPAAAITSVRGDTRGVSGGPGPWRRLFEGLGAVRIAGDRIITDKKDWRWTARPSGNGGLLISLDGVSRRYAVAQDEDSVWVSREGHHLHARLERKTGLGGVGQPGSLEAPMPGRVLHVHVENGDQVEEGDVLLVLESMKMEFSVTAPCAGKVARLDVKPGDRVIRHQALVAVTE